jgi:DNA processing protein
MERAYYLPFSQFSGIGPHKFNSLIKHFGSAKKAYSAKQNELSKIIGEITAEKFDDFRSKFDLARYEKELKQKKIDYVCLFDEIYPSLLKKISNPPILLYLKGNLSLLESSPSLATELVRQPADSDIHSSRSSKLSSQTGIIAIVGTRKITSYGQEVTDLFSSNRALSGFVIVSGMALGVDGQAHKSCLEAGGKTIAVLGNGVDLPFPPTNKFLYDLILKNGGAVISEFPPGEPPSKGTFPSRNRIIAGISQAVLVTQGAEDSGSMITAEFALKFGRPVFAVPGPITSSLSKGPNILISKGAKLVFDPKDILKELGISASAKASARHRNLDGLTKDEQKIVQLLENETLPFDEIAKKLKIKTSKLGTTLSIMEIDGIIKNRGGEYSLA